MLIHIEILCHFPSRVSNFVQLGSTLHYRLFDIFERKIHITRSTIDLISDSHSLYHFFKDTLDHFCCQACTAKLVDYFIHLALQARQFPPFSKAFSLH
jgi:hypothetical protein